MSVGSAGSGEQVRRCDDDLDGLSRISQDQDGLLSQDSQDGHLSQNGLALNGLDPKALPNKTVCMLPNAAENGLRLLKVSVSQGSGG